MQVKILHFTVTNVTYNEVCITIKVLKMPRLFYQDQDQDQDFFLRPRPPFFFWWVSRPRPKLWRLHLGRIMWFYWAYNLYTAYFVLQSCCIIICYYEFYLCVWIICRCWQCYQSGRQLLLSLLVLYSLLLKLLHHGLVVKINVLSFSSFWLNCLQTGQGPCFANLHVMRLSHNRFMNAVNSEPWNTLACNTTSVLPDVPGLARYP